MGRMSGMCRETVENGAERVAESRLRGLECHAKDRGLFNVHIGQDDLGRGMGWTWEGRELRQKGELAGY